MSKTNQVVLREKIQKLAVMAILSAIVAVLSYFGGFIKIGAFASISLTLIPVVFGSALYGPLAGAWLGAVSGAVFFATADAVFWVSLSLVGTIVTVMVKGILSGFFAGLVYKLTEKFNRYLAVVLSAIVCPLVNTGLFLLGCVLFFSDFVIASSAEQGMSMFGFMIVFFVGLNFVFELLVNVIVSPAIVRVVQVLKEQK
ncbi:MAG: ECF transporter S component [Clostridia bacterium]|nr:ECF transporter S component [Clostridia bacterium]